jgi:hypothetical protein
MLCLLLLVACGVVFLRLLDQNTKWPYDSARGHIEGLLFYRGLRHNASAPRFSDPNVDTATTGSRMVSWDIYEAWGEVEYQNIHGKTVRDSWRMMLEQTLDGPIMVRSWSIGNAASRTDEMSVLVVTPAGRMPKPTPTVPASVASLPVQGRALCTARGLMANIYEFPGLTPKDAGSDPSYVGRIIGRLEGCVPVTVVAVAWSEYDQKFYVRIKSPVGEGWIGLSLVEVPYP